MLRFITSLQARLHQEKGATMVEYGILISLISIAAIAAIILIGPKLLSAFSSAETAIP
jgi:pilus assembly protein Flp/PilA